MAQFVPLSYARNDGGRAFVTCVGLCGKQEASRRVTCYQEPLSRIMTRMQNVQANAQASRIVDRIGLSLHMYSDLNCSVLSGAMSRIHRIPISTILIVFISLIIRIF